MFLKHGEPQCGSQAECPPNKDVRAQAGENKWWAHVKREQDTTDNKYPGIEYWERAIQRILLPTW